MLIASLSAYHADPRSHAHILRHLVSGYNMAAPSDAAILGSNVTWSLHILISLVINEWQLGLE